MEQRKLRKDKGLPYNSLTLKEKFAEHYRTRNFEPSISTVTRFAVSFVWVHTLTLVLEGLFLLIPSYHLDYTVNNTTNTSCDSNSRASAVEGCGSSSSRSIYCYRLAQLATLWLCLESLCQWWFIRDAGSNFVTAETKQKAFPGMRNMPAGWKKCSICKYDIPPRAHHCDICNRCILKRDHHCFFSGSCVGLYNQRHFVFFLLYTSAACAYAVFMQFVFLNKKTPFLSTKCIFYFPLAALWQLKVGETNLTHVLVLVHLYISVASLVASVGFVRWQLLIIFHGQTSYEDAKGIRLYRKRSTYENYVSVFGPAHTALLSFLVPLRIFDIPENGIEWEEEKRLK